MSLNIDQTKVTRVLLADGWHDVASMSDGRSSFFFDAFELAEFKADGVTRVWSVQLAAEPAGVSFIDESTQSRVCAPLTSVLALMDTEDYRSREE